MKRLVLAVVLAAVTILVMSGSIFAQSKPEFRLGFKDLADQIPNIAGQPLEDERYDANGDSIQRTTTGLMVWRKSDRWTAFTNGQITWILGPYGLQSRLNSQLYPWENVPPGPTPISEQPVSQPQLPVAPAPFVAPTATATPWPTPAFVPPTFTPTTLPTQTYSPDVRAMDPESAGLGITVKNFAAEIDSEWAWVWGWRPHKPTTVYLYYDGVRLAYGMNEILGSNLSSYDMERVSSTNLAARGRDLKTGGWAILMHVNYRWGMEDWEATTKATFLHEYAYLMINEVAGETGPQWFREGFAQWLTYQRVNSTTTEQSAVDYVARARKDGILPSLHSLNNFWSQEISTSSENLERAYGVSYLTIKYLTQRVGGMPILQVLQRTASGQDFETALSALTGYNLNTLNGDYRSLIPEIKTEEE